MTQERMMEAEPEPQETTGMSREVRVQYLAMAAALGMILTVWAIGEFAQSRAQKLRVQGAVAAPSSTAQDININKLALLMVRLPEPDPDALAQAPEAQFGAPGQADLQGLFREPQAPASAAAPSPPATEPDLSTLQPEPAPAFIAPPVIETTLAPEPAADLAERVTAQMVTPAGAVLNGRFVRVGKFPCDAVPGLEASFCTLLVADQRAILRADAVETVLERP